MSRSGTIHRRFRALLLVLAMVGTGALALPFRLVDAVENLPSTASWMRAFETILAQELVPYRSFGVRPGRRVHRERTIAFLAQTLGRPASDEQIIAAIDGLTPATTVGAFLRMLYGRETLTPEDLAPLLEIANTATLAEAPQDQRIVRLQQVTVFRRELLQRLALAPVIQAGGALDVIFADTLQALPRGHLHLSAPRALFPRRWERRTRRWRNPNALNFLRALRAEAAMQVRQLTMYLSVRATGLAGATDVRGFIRHLQVVQAVEPGLVQGIQIGDAWNDLPNAPLLGVAEQRAARDKFLALFQFCGANGLMVRIDGFALSNRGLLYEPLAEALRVYDGTPLQLFFSHTLAMDPSWWSPDRGIGANKQLRVTFEQSPFVTAYLGPTKLITAEPVAEKVPVEATSLGYALLGHSAPSTVLDMFGLRDCFQMIFESGVESGTEAPSTPPSVRPSPSDEY